MRQYLTIFLLVGAPFCLAQPQNSADYGLRIYVQETFSPLSLVSSAAAAGIGQWRDRPEQWKQGGQGYAYRYASSYGEHIVHNTLLFGASSVLHEDYRYVRSGQSGFGSRVAYAVESTCASRQDNGSRRFSLSRIGAFAGAALISRLWQPKSTNRARSAMLNFGTTIGVSAGVDVAREFWPQK